jgi:hypothetical protein
MVKNPVAKARSSGVCHPQVIPPKKGKGSVPLVRLMPLPRGLSIKEAPAYWAGALSLGEETPKEGKQ